MDVPTDDLTLERYGFLVELGFSAIVALAIARDWNVRCVEAADLMATIHRERPWMDAEVVAMRCLVGVEEDAPAAKT